MWSILNHVSGIAIEVACIVAVVHPVVELYGLIPVEDAWKCRKTVVASGFGRKFHIGIVAGTHVDAGRKQLSRYVVEVVVAVEKFCGVVAFAEVFYAAWGFVAVVLPAYMVGDEVHYHVHAALVGAVDQSLEFFDTLVDILGDVGVNIIVVGYRIWRAGFSLDDMGVMAGYAVAGIVGCMGMFYDAGIPHGGDSEFLYGAEYRRGYVVHLS